MPIPNINLIPSAYYLRKKVKAATAMAIAALFVVTGALVAFAVFQNSENARLALLQAEWQAKADTVKQTNEAATAATTAVKDVETKTTFINNALKANAYWATVFEGIRDYSYPGVVYTSVKPTPNGTSVAMHIRVVGNRKINPVRALNWYVRNLRRSPMIKAVLPSGYPAQASDTTGATASLGGPPMAGGPPMPGGPGGGRYVGSAQSLTGPALEGANNYSQALGGPTIGMPQLGMPADATGGLGGVPLPQGPPLYDVDVTAELMNPIALVTAGGARTQ